MAVGPKRLGTSVLDLNILHCSCSFKLIVFEKSKTLEIQKNSMNSKLCIFLWFETLETQIRKEQKQWIKNCLHLEEKILESLMLRFFAKDRFLYYFVLNSEYVEVFV